MPTRACRSQTSRREWLEEQEAGEEGEGEEGEGLPPVAAETAVTSSTAKSAAACHLEPSPASASDASSSGPVHALEHAGRGTEAARAVEASEDEDEIVLTFWGGITAASDGTDLQKALYALLNVGFLLLSVVLARRVYNDAVRDTLALRERRPVRWLKLGGRAALPSYFEIAELAQR